MRYLFLNFAHSSELLPPMGTSRRSILRFWDSANCKTDRNWSLDIDLEKEASFSQGVVAYECKLSELDSLYRLRAVQINERRSNLDLPSVVFIADSGDQCQGIAGQRRRIVSSWPFASVLFVADGGAADLLAREGLPVIGREEASALGYEGLMAHPDRLICRAAAEQKVAVHIQALWRMCGSTTAFANQLECLADDGDFVIRIFMADSHYDTGVIDWLRHVLPDNRTFMGPHLEAIACADARQDTTESDAAVRWERNIQFRTKSEVTDRFTLRLIARASIAVVNHAVNIVFALRNMPEAKLVLETHDYVTRWALERALQTQSSKDFPVLASLRRHVRLERDLWRAADVCSVSSSSELKRVLRHVPQCRFVIGRSYARPWIHPDRDLEWDCLIVADGHPFNLESLEYFLSRVVEPDARMRKLRIGIAGNIAGRDLSDKSHPGTALVEKWRPRLANVSWLGFVTDLETLQNNSLLWINPDRRGTGISVKSLTAIASGQPLVGTSLALRGMPEAARQALRVFDDAEAMAQEIHTLVTQSDKLQKRIEDVHRARDCLYTNENSYRALIDLAKARSCAFPDTRRALLDRFSPARKGLYPRWPEEIDFSNHGNGRRYLGMGWWEAEDWGRWTLGRHGVVHIPARWVRWPLKVSVRVTHQPVSDRPTALFCQGQNLVPERGFSTEPVLTAILDKSNLDPDQRHVSLEVVAESSFVPARQRGGDDYRELGARLISIRFKHATKDWRYRLYRYYDRNLRTFIRPEKPFTGQRELAPDQIVQETRAAEKRIYTLRRSALAVRDNCAGDEFLWNETMCLVGHDWARDELLLTGLTESSGAIFRDISLNGVDSIFRLRALQLLKKQGALKCPSVVYISNEGVRALRSARLRERIVHSWPFETVLFVAEPEAAKWLRREGLPVVDSSEAEKLSEGRLLSHPAALRSRATEKQKIGIVTQALWPWSGSSTAFLNQVDSLLDQGLFVIRVFNTDMPYGHNAQSLLKKFLPNNRVHSGAHVESLACPSEAAPDAGGDEHNAFVRFLHARSSAEIVDSPARELARRASVLICNAATETLFAARISPKATIVLDTHDYLTRYIYNRPRPKGAPKPFASTTQLKKQVQLERDLWAVADVCTAVSVEESLKISRYVKHCLQVIPRPYTSAWRDPGEKAEWDIAIAADANPYAIHSLRWFLSKVIEPEPRLHRIRIGIAGNVKPTLEPEWASKLPNVKWLGFVDDLDELFHSARLSVNSDISGTGISVKILTSLAYGMPLAATRDAFRGLPVAISSRFPTCETGADMAREIVRLLGDRDAYATRVKLVSETAARLDAFSSYADAMALGKADPLMRRRTEVAALAKYVRPEVERRGLVSPDDPAAALRLDFSATGNSADFRGSGWHFGEAWGRWTDGPHATIRLPAAWLAAPRIAIFDVVPNALGGGFALRAGTRFLTPPGTFVYKDKIAIALDPSLRRASDDTVTIEILVEKAFSLVGSGSDDRVLGLGVRSVTLVAEKEMSGTIELMPKRTPAFAA